MKTIYKIAFFLLACCLCVVLVSYSNNFTAEHFHLIDKDKANAKPLRYHFVMIAQDINDPFWQSVEKGAKQAGDKYQAAVEFNGPMIQNEDEEIQYLNIAIAANVDGIAVYVSDKTKFKPLINEAIGKGINVVTLESDDIHSNRKAYIGPNSYDIGTAESSLVAEAENGSSNVALILGGNYAENSDLSDSLMKGFKDGVKSHPEIRLKTIQNSSSGYFKAEKIIRSILYSQPDINTVVCTSANDTFEIVQVLIDLNKTGSVTVIGFSNSAQIRDYIKNNVIFGSVYENPENTGYKSIECLTALCNKKPTSSVRTGVYTVTRNNLVNYPDGS